MLRELDDSVVEEAGALVAAEQDAARRSSPELPVLTPAECADAIVHSGQVHGVVVVGRGRVRAVLGAAVREVSVVGRYARFGGECVAVDPSAGDPTALLAEAYAEVARRLVDEGVRLHYLLHVARPRLAEAWADLGFGRDGVYAVRPAAPLPHEAPHVVIREAGPEDRDSVAALARVELAHRSAPPMFGPPAPEWVEDPDATYLIAAVDGVDVGLLTREPHSPAPRLCPAGTPFVGVTATLPRARRTGVGRALVARAAAWGALSVDFASANPLSRPFWLGCGFRPTGYGLVRHLPAYG